MATEVDRSLFEKAIDITGMALRGSMGGQGSQPPSYAADVFREVWKAIREEAAQIPDRPKTGF